MSRNDLMGDVENSYQSLKQLIKETNDLPEESDSLHEDDDDDYLQSLIDHDVNDVLYTLPSMNNYVDIQIGDMSEDIRRNAVVSIHNYTKDMNLRGVKNLRIDYDGNIELDYISNYLDLDNLVIKMWIFFHGIMCYHTVRLEQFDSKIVNWLNIILYVHYLMMLKRHWTSFSRRLIR